MRIFFFFFFSLWLSTHTYPQKDCKNFYMNCTKPADKFRDITDIFTTLSKVFLFIFLVLLLFYQHFVLCSYQKTVLSCVWLCDPLDCSPPDFSVYGILQARILEWVAISSSNYEDFHPIPSVQFSSATPSCPTICDPWTAAGQASLSITNTWSLLRLMSIESGMPSNHLILCHRLLLPPSIFPSIRIFSNESVLCIRWPEYQSISFSISPSNEYSGLISFRMNWLDLLAVHGTLKSLLQHHSSKASILRHSAFFIVQLSHPYMTTGKTIAWTRWTFVGKVMSLLFNTLSMLVMTFLPKSKHLLISWLQSLSAVILEPRKIAPVSTVSPSICHEVMGPDAMILVF